MDTFLSPESVTREQAEEILTRFAATDAGQFKSYFLHLHRASPRESLRACVRHLAEHGADACAKSLMLPWVVQKPYFDLLLDPQFLTIEAARKAAAVLRVHDPQFFQRFHLLANGSNSAESSAALARALLLLEGIEDHAVLFPWLQSLTRYPDRRIQSQAVKALCKVRANAAVIARQLKSDDPRVRANAVEALWYSQAPEAAQFFREALADPHHRVVVNALVGLHYQHDAAAFEKLLVFAAGSSDPFRLAAVWAFGHLADTRAVPVLQELLAGELPPGLQASAARVLTTLTSASR